MVIGAGGLPLWPRANGRIVRVRLEAASEYVDVGSPCVWTLRKGGRARSFCAPRLGLDDARYSHAHRAPALNGSRTRKRGACCSTRIPRSPFGAKLSRV